MKPYVLRSIIDSRTYKIINLNRRYPIYWDEGIYLKKGHISYKYRSYKTWKHSRKIQYKTYVYNKNK